MAKLMGSHMFDKDISNIRHRACRTTAEAFPTGPEYACAVERPSRGHRAAYWTMALAVAYLAGLLIWEAFL